MYDCLAPELFKKPAHDSAECWGTASPNHGCRVLDLGPEAGKPLTPAEAEARLPGYLRAIWSPWSGERACVCTAGTRRRTCSVRRSKMTSKKEKKGRRENNPSTVASAPLLFDSHLVPRRGIFFFYAVFFSLLTVLILVLCKTFFFF